MAIGYSIDKDTLFLFGIPIYLIIVIIMILKKRKMNKRISLRVEIIRFIFFIYIIAVAGVTLTPINIVLRGKAIHESTLPINYVPVVSILKDASEIGNGRLSVDFQIMQFLRNVGGNFILLMPLGFILPVISKRFNSFKKVLLFCFIVSFSIEMIQLLEVTLDLVFARIADIDDIILNTLGAATGYALYYFINLVLRKYGRREAVKRNI